MLALKTQLAKLEKKIGELQDERMGLLGKSVLDEGYKGLHAEVLQALDKAIAAVQSAKQGRQDRLSYYDGMEEPEGCKAAAHGESCGLGSMLGAKLAASSTALEAV
eukprot:jgi/Ulvmu1/757/UM010_0131.1